MTTDPGHGLVPPEPDATRLKYETVLRCIAVTLPLVILGLIAVLSAFVHLCFLGAIFPLSLLADVFRASRNAASKVIEGLEYFALHRLPRDRMP